MRNGDPTSLRMAFGYTEASASGVTGFEAPPNARKMNWHKQCAEAEKKIAALVRADPSISQLAMKLFEELKRRNLHGAPQVLESIYWNRPELAPAGYWDNVPYYWLPEAVKKTRQPPEPARRLPRLPQLN
jgi:hypothetical protein